MPEIVKQAEMILNHSIYKPRLKSYGGLTNKSKNNEIQARKFQYVWYQELFRRLINAKKCYLFI